MADKFEILGIEQTKKQLEEIVNDISRIATEIGKVNNAKIDLTTYQNYDKKLSEITASNTELETSLKKLEAQYKKLKTQRGRTLSGLSEEERLIIQNIKMEEKLAVAKKTNIKVSGDAYRQNQQLKKVTSELNKELKNETNAYGQLTNEINKDALAVKNLMVQKARGQQINEQELATTQERLLKNRELQSSIYAQTNTIASLGQQTKSYSGISSAFVTEAGRGIQDLRYGIVGVANNITQMADQFKLAVEQAGGTRGALKDIGRSLRGMGGYILSFNIAMAVFNTEWFTNMVKSSQNIKKLQNAFFKFISAKGGIRDFKSVIKDAVSQSDKSVGRFKLLTNVMLDNASSAKEKATAMKAIKKEYPKFNAEVLTDKENHDGANLAIRKYTKTLKEKGLALAVARKQTAAYNEIARLELEQEEVIADKQEDVSRLRESISNKEEQLKNTTNKRAKARRKAELIQLKNNLKNITEVNSKEIKIQEELIEKLNKIAKRRGLDLAKKDDTNSSKDKSFSSFEETETAKLKLQIKKNQEKIDDEETTKEIKDKLTKENFQLYKDLADEELKIDQEKAQAKIDEAVKEGKFITETKKEVNKELENLDTERASKQIDIDTYQKEQLKKNREEDFAKEVEVLDLKKAKALITQEELHKAELDSINKSNKTDKEKKDLLKDEETSHKSEMLKINLKYYKELLELQRTNTDLTEKELSEIELKIAELDRMLSELGKAGTTDAKKGFFEKYNKEIDASMELMGTLADMSAAFTDRKLQEIDKELNALEESHERKMEMMEAEYEMANQNLEESTERSLEVNATLNQDEVDKALNADLIRKSSAKKKDALDKEREKREKKAEKDKEKREEQLQRKKIELQRRQAIFDKAVGIAGAGINTARGITSALAMSPPNPILAGVIGAIGAAQIATIAATPLPAFAEGGEMEKDGLMLINDHPSGRQEFIKRDGKILTTDKKDAVVKGKKGDEIYKDYDTMVDNFIMNKAMHPNIQQIKVENDNTDKLEKAITKTMKRGFRDVTVQNHVSLSNFNAYQQSLNQ